jgi:hypothetical protein
MPASGWAVSFVANTFRATFFGRAGFLKGRVRLMVRGSAGIRRARWGAACALVLACVGVPAGRARQQDSAADSAQRKSATAEIAPHKRHLTTSQASMTSSGAAKSSASTGTHSRRKKSSRARGQQKIDSERAKSIQEALIREHYLSGEATGTWNQSSEEAMRRYQADHGWQSKTVPDSRALIKLGLGPSNDHLLNPESAMITRPDAPRSESIPPTSHTGPPSSDPPPAPSPQ